MINQQQSVVQLCISEPESDSDQEDVPEESWKPRVNLDVLQPLLVKFVTLITFMKWVLWIISKSLFVAQYVDHGKLCDLTGFLPHVVTYDDPLLLPQVLT